MSDRDPLSEYLQLLFGYMGGAVISGMVYLGERLGLYRAMHGAGPLSSDELADRTGLDRRWLLEWLRAQGAAGLVDYTGDDRFELNDLQGFVLADEENSPAFAGGVFAALPHQIGVLPRLEESFRTGVGLPYDAFGEEGSHALARGLGPFNRLLLVPMILPALDGVVPKLEAGAKVADVGCGAGVALFAMADAFPSSEFHGYDISKHALTLAERERTDHGAGHVRFHDVRAEALPADASFDLVTAFDCIHDMTHPQETLSAIRRALKDDGTLLIADIKSHATYEENVERNPMAAMMYSMSVMSCMSSALSEPGGAGLGTLGFHRDLAQEMTERAGFTRFRVHDFENPINAYYEVRP